VEAGRSWNELRFLAADRSGKDSYTTYVLRRNDERYYYYYYYYYCLELILDNMFLPRRLNIINILLLVRTRKCEE